MFVVVWCSLLVVVSCELYGRWCVLFGVCYVDACGLALVVWWLVFGVWCLVLSVCLAFGVERWLCVACCLLFVSLC